MSGRTLRKHFMRRFLGMSRYARPVSWLILSAYLGAIMISIGFGSYLLTLPVTIWTCIGIFATAVFIGTRLRGINNIVHECSHATFSERREDNVVIGRVCTAILMKAFRKYRDDHLSHHANNGDYEHDAEFAVIEKFGLHDPLTRRTIARHVVTPLLGRHLPYYTGINLSAEDGRIYLALKLALLAAMAVFLLLNPLAAILFVIVPLFYIYPTLNFWTDCLDHAGLVGAKDELEASRNVLAPALVRLIFFPRNDSYHLVHHLFPQVPAQHLHRAHAELCSDPSYRNTTAAVRPETAAEPRWRLGSVLGKHH
jgi:fatty acid desaturase